MPKYKWNIKDLIFEEDVKKIYAQVDGLLKKALISVCWLTGARTSEILEIAKADVGFGEDYLELRLKTKKLGDGDYKTETRTLKFTRPHGIDSNIYIETIIKYAASIQDNEDLLFHTPGNTRKSYSSRWVESRLVGPTAQKVLGKWLTPYHFRHSCMQWLAYHGAGMAQLMHFKGAKSPLSVQPYISAVPTLLKIENLKRDRALQQDINEVQPKVIE